FREGRFLAALLVGNFVLVPLAVWGLSRFLPRDPAILLGTLMVLLVPCTDWFITFAQLGRGDARLAIAATPINLLAQIVLLPAYLWLFAGDAFAGAVEPRRFLGAFLGLILLPLLLAAVTQRWAERRPGRHRWRDQIDRTPVPLLAVVVFLIAASQAGTVVHSLHALGRVAIVFVAYLVLAAYLGLATAKIFRLPPPATRTLIFSLGTRNSFVVLPFALALPAGWDAATVVIVLQSLVELFGMIGYLWWVPHRLAP
ncbi:MAG TPA: bile acid:sodium symporter, partial [Candidatus Limnocylindria bacterium]|nr:bile acid:sodium symporter [Candidatus Limnocylindria bacterium]